MAKTPDEIVADIDRKQNAEDKDLLPRIGRMTADKVEKAFKRMSTPSSSPAVDTMGNVTGMKSGGKVSSASARADGCCIRGKTKA